MRTAGALLAAMALLVPNPRPAEAADGAVGVAALATAPFSARAVGVSDGDTVVVLADDGVRHRIRIGGIDAPEKGQPFADVSRRHLAGLLREQVLRVEPIKRDPYGRTVANLSVGDEDVGLVMLRAGLAWHFVRYARDQTRAQRQAYASAETAARSDRAGLWKEPVPEPPWEYRARQRRAAEGQAAGR